VPKREWHVEAEGILDNRSLPDADFGRALN
jgi:hypothetical protein